MIPLTRFHSPLPCSAPLFFLATISLYFSSNDLALVRPRRFLSEMLLVHTFFQLPSASLLDNWLFLLLSMLDCDWPLVPVMIVAHFPIYHWPDDFCISRCPCGRGLQFHRLILHPLFAGAFQAISCISRHVRLVSVYLRFQVPQADLRISDKGSKGFPSRALRLHKHCLNNLPLEVFSTFHYLEAWP